MAGAGMHAQALRPVPRAGDAARPATERPRAVRTPGFDPVGAGAVRAAAALAAAAGRGLVLA